MNLYVSNLAYSLTDDELRSEFAAYGTVANARVVLDRETGRSRGFGFVEMPNDAEARAAIQRLEGSNVGGRPIRVVEARPKEERPQRPPYAGGGGGSGAQRGGGQGDRGERRDFGGGGKKDWSRSGRGERGSRDRGGFEGGDF